MVTYKKPVKPLKLKGSKKFKSAKSNNRKDGHTITKQHSAVSQDLWLNEPSKTDRTPRKTPLKSREVVPNKSANKISNKKSMVINSSAGLNSNAYFSEFDLYYDNKPNA